MTAPPPKPGILDIPLYAPGRATLAGVARPVKLSANENALGCSARARAAYIEAASGLHLYPDMHAVSLRAAVARKYGLEENRLIFGAGSDELFTIACQTYLSPGDNAVQPQFGFAAWAIAARAAGGDIRSAPERNYHVDVDALLAAADARTRIVFVANPSNPTGTVIPFDEIERLHAALPARVLLIIDGAYSEFADREGDYAREFALARSAPNILVTKTFSKLYGLAALRVGWGCGAAGVIAAMERVRPPFNTTGPAQAAAAASLEDDDFIERSVRHVVAAREELAAYFSRYGLEVLPSAANFVTVRFADAALTAQAAESALAEKGILVRGLRNYGMTDFLRVTAGPKESLAAFMTAFDEIAENAGLSRR